MLALKSRYDGTAVILDRKPPVSAGDVIVTFLDSPVPERVGASQRCGASLRCDDGSLAYLFESYTDDGIRWLTLGKPSGMVTGAGRYY
jgi:hypothetical protein